MSTDSNEVHTFSALCAIPTERTRRNKIEVKREQDGKRKREKERNFAWDLAQHRDLHERSGPRGARRYVDTYVRRHRVWHEGSPPGRSRCPRKSMETIFGCREINCNHQRGVERIAEGRRVWDVLDVYVTFSAARFIRRSVDRTGLPSGNQRESLNDFMAATLWSRRYACRRSVFRPAQHLFLGHLRYSYFIFL